MRHSLFFMTIRIFNVILFLNTMFIILKTVNIAFQTKSLYFLN